MKKICSIIILLVLLVNLTTPITKAFQADNEIKENIPKKEEIESEEELKETEQQKNEIEEANQAPTGNNTNTEQEKQEIDENKKQEESNSEEVVEEEKMTEKQENAEENSINQINTYNTIEKTRNTKGLEGKTYIIEALVGTNMCLDVYGAYKEDGANVQIFKEDNGENKKFKLVPVEDGNYYEIEAMHSGKVLDIYGAYKENGTNVNQYHRNNGDNQKWEFVEVEKDVYNIVSKNGMYLDIHGANSANGTNVEIFDGNGGINQKFRLKEDKTSTPNLGPEKTKDDGIYEIKSAIGTNMYLDVYGADNTPGANLQIAPRNGNRNQKFQVTKNENDNYYTITALHSGQALDVYGAYKTNGTNVTQYTATKNAENQQWEIKDVGNNYFNIISKCNGLCLDIHGANGNKGSNVEVFQSNGGTNQKFKFIKVNEEKPILNEGEYKFISVADEQKAIEVEGASAKDETNIKLGKENNVKEQVFSLKYNEDGTYLIKPTFSGRVLDIYGAYTTDGTNVQETRENGGDNQRWKFKKDKDGNYNIVASYKDDFYMTANGSNIEMKTNTGSNNQKFKIIPYTTNEKPLVYDGTYKITTALASNMALDVKDGSKAPKAGMQIWNNLHVLNQKFRLKHLGDNIYTIQIVHSNMALEVATDGSNEVRQNTIKENALEQKWKLTDAGDGYCFISSEYMLSKYNKEMCLDIFRASSANGTKVQLYEKNGNNNEKWKLQEMYFGVDVSEHNHTLDFGTLKRTGQTEFMITRVGWYSNSRKQFIEDLEFERNYNEAKRNGIPLGAYLYSYAQTDAEARSEAEALVKHLKGKKFDLPIFLDIEDPKYQSSLSVQQRTNICLIYGNVLKSAGYKVGIYTFKNWALGAIDMNQIPNDYAIWIAAWGANNGSVPPDFYKYAFDHDIWQYTSSGDVEGIPTRTDINVTYKKLW